MRLRRMACSAVFLLTGLLWNASVVAQDLMLTKDSERGFQRAAKELISNLDQQLALFKDRIKKEPEEYKVVHRPGYSGGGSLGAVFPALLALVGGYTWLRRRRR